MLGFVPLAIAGGALLVNPAIDGAWRSGRISVQDVYAYRKFLSENRANEAKAARGGRAAEVREIRKHRAVIEQRVKDALAFTQAGRAGRVRVLPLHRANLNAIYPHLLSLSASIDAASRPAVLVSSGLPVARGLTKPQLFAAWRFARTPAQRAEILRKLYVFHRVTPAELQSQGIVPTPVTLTPTAFTASTPAFVSSASTFVPASSTAPGSGATSAEAAAAPAFTPSTETPAFVSSETPAEAPAATNWLLIGGVVAAAGILYVMSKKKKASAA